MYTAAAARQTACVRDGTQANTLAYCCCCCCCVKHQMPVAIRTHAQPTAGGFVQRRTYSSVCAAATQASARCSTSTKRTFETPPTLSAYAPAPQAMVDYCCTHQARAQPHAHPAAAPIAPLCQPCHLDCRSCCLCRQQRPVCVRTVVLGYGLGWCPIKSRAVSRGALWTALGCSCGMWPRFQSCNRAANYAQRCVLCKPTSDALVNVSTGSWQVTTA
jgi:hypothetical protein